MATAIVKRVAALVTRHRHRQAVTSTSIRRLHLRHLHRLLVIAKTRATTTRVATDAVHQTRAAATRAHRLHVAHALQSAAQTKTL